MIASLKQTLPPIHASYPRFGTDSPAPPPPPPDPVQLTQPSEEPLPKKKKLFLSTLRLLAAGALAMPSGFALQLIVKSWIAGRPALDYVRGAWPVAPIPARDNGYPANTSLLLSGPQFALNTLRQRDFSWKLADAIRSLPENGALEEAFQRVATEGFDGYWPLKAFPVRSGSPVQGWRIQDRHTPRFALLFYEADDPLSPQFKEKTEGVAAALRERFQLTSAQLRVVGINRSEQTEEEIKQLKATILKMQKSDPQQPKPEILLYFNTHAYEPMDRDVPEGNAVGWITGLQEDDLAKHLRSMAKDVQTATVVMDSCFSGTFSKVEPPPQKIIHKKPASL
jgi:hypothetical protein